mgnify:CR=1 FL=1
MNQPDTETSTVDVTPEVSGLLSRMLVEMPEGDVSAPVVGGIGTDEFTQMNKLLQPSHLL